MRLIIRINVLYFTFLNHLLPKQKGKQNEYNSCNEAKMPAIPTSKLARKYHPPTKTRNLHESKFNVPKCYNKEFPFGSIVEIPGPTLDAERWENTQSPPHFMGAILNPENLDPDLNLYCNED